MNQSQNVKITENSENRIGNNRLGNKSINNFPEITFKSQNVRSFDISNANKTTELKMFSLVKEKDDIIFVSDTRLNTEIQKSALNSLEKKLLLSGYDCFFNSETSNRGTGILNKIN